MSRARSASRRNACRSARRSLHGRRAAQSSSRSETRRRSARATAACSRASPSTRASGPRPASHDDRATRAALVTTTSRSAPPTRGARNGRDSTREGEILTAAARIFREKGYHGTSVQDIAEAVGLLKGSLYHYIRSKEQLLARLFEGSLGGTIDELETIAARSGSATDRLRDMVRVYVMSVTA